MTNRSYRDIFDRLKARERELAASSAAERIAKIERLYQAVYELRAEIGAAGMAEIGLDGRAQVLPLKDYVVNIRENLADWMTPKDQPQSPALAGRRAYVHHEPKGVVLHLSTWNAPVLMSLAPVMSMIAAGNAVVLKPSEIAPHAADAVAKVIEKGGLGDDIAVGTGGREQLEWSLGPRRQKSPLGSWTSAVTLESDGGGPGGGSRTAMGLVEPSGNASRASMMQPGN